jgi:hypothetical protein
MVQHIAKHTGDDMAHLIAKRSIIALTEGGGFGSAGPAQHKRPHGMGEYHYYYD